MSSRTFDIIIWGATGFTGALCAEYLATRFEALNLKWALAGRSIPRLTAVRATLVAINPKLAELPLLYADASSDSSLKTLVSQTKVVIATVGPFLLHGKLLLKACLEAGTDYCDITGESVFMRQSADAYDVIARERNTLVVHACGMDSVPSDVSVFAAYRRLLQYMNSLGARAPTITKFEARGFLMATGSLSMSGGTIASMLNLIESPERKRGMSSPYYLCPQKFADSGPQMWVRKYPFPGVGMTFPFIMAAVNEQVVRRTNALTNHQYSVNFSYHEAQKARKGYIQAVLMTLGIFFFFLLLIVPFTRKFVKRFLPQSGQGPDRATRDRGFLQWSTFVTATLSNGEVKKIRTDFEESLGDPGYKYTAVMLCEAALTMALQRSACAAQGGVHTPVSGLGAAYVERLRLAGTTIKSDFIDF